MRRTNVGLNVTIFVVLLAAVLGGLTWVNYRFVLQNPGGNDFLARWMGARFWLKEGISPYDEAVSLESQIVIYGHPADPSIGEDKNHFVYPMYSMVFFGPFGLLEYDIARTVFMTILEVCLVALTLVGIRLVEWRPRFWMTAVLLVFSLVWYHGARTAILGQFAAINALMITTALLWIRNRQDTGAGFLLALTTSKPPMVFLLAPFVVLWAFSQRRWGIIRAFFITFGVLVGVSLILLPNWPLQWLVQLVDYPTYTTTVSALTVLTSTMPGIQATLNIGLHALAYIYLAVEWVRAWGKDERWFIWTALLTTVITNMVAIRTATTNYLMMVPILLLTFRLMEQRWKGAGSFVAVLVQLALVVGLWYLFITTVEGNIESPWMYLPLPFLCLFALWWVRWWAMRPARLQLEEFAARLG